MYKVPFADFPVAPAGEQNAPGEMVGILVSCVALGVGVGVTEVVTVGVGVGVGVAATVGVGDATGIGLWLALGVGTGVLEVVGVGAGWTGADWYEYPLRTCTGIFPILQISK